MRLGIVLDGCLLAFKTDKQFDARENDMPFGSFGRLLPGAKALLRGLKDDGWELVLITDRLELSLVRSYVLNELRLPIDRISTPANPIVCDALLSPSVVCFDGKWDERLKRRLKRHKTWEEKKKRGKVKVGAAERKKGPPLT